MTRYLCTGILTFALVISGCVGMPISSMLKLRKLDPLETDPAQIKVAILADDRLGIPDGSARLELTADTEDGALHIDESYVIEIVRDRVFATELTGERTAGESITVLQLSDDDAREMRQALAEMESFRDSGQKGSASLGVGLEGLCQVRPIPANRVSIDIFLRTHDDDEFFPIARNLDLAERLEETGYSPTQWPSCDTAT